MVKCGGCYDDDIGGFCQTWEHTFSCNLGADEYDKKGFAIILTFLLICLGIVIISILSIYYSSKFENEMSENCDFNFNEDYKINFWKISKIILPLIIVLYFIEIILCIYSLCHAIIKFK